MCILVSPLTFLLGRQGSLELSLVDCRSDSLVGLVDEGVQRGVVTPEDVWKTGEGEGMGIVLKFTSEC